MSKRKKQVAALPVKLNGNQLKILLITSRDTGRWVMPKGWPMDGKKDWRAAEIEALEEAGVKGNISSEIIGTFTYPKVFENGDSTSVEVTVYPMYVERVKKRWKERHERKRRWFSPKGAARALELPEFENVLLKINKNPRKHEHLRKLIP